MCIRASQFAKVARKLAGWGSFARIFNVRNRSGLIFPFGDDLGLPILDRSFNWKSIDKNVGQGKTQNCDYKFYPNVLKCHPIHFSGHPCLSLVEK